MHNEILITQPAGDYNLLDSGDSEKLEEYGDVVVRRPDPQALWPKRLKESEWAKAHAIFDGKDSGWQFKKELPARWQIDFAELKFWIRPSSFKHTGIFPEQQPNWEWIVNKVKSRKSQPKAGPPLAEKVISQVNVLNLFGYTGGATLAAAQAGASVCHVDGSKVAMSWAHDNAELSGLAEKPIRWILDDVVTFVKREIKRGRRYDGIILDPPAFGHGPKKELWKIEKDLLPLLDLLRQVLSDKPLFFLLNGYASGYSAIAYANNLQPFVKSFGGEIEMGELTIREAGEDGRLLPCGIFARWSM